MTTRRTLILGMLVGVSPVADLAAGEGDPSALADRLSRWLSPSLREDEQSLEQLHQQLVQLPPLTAGHRGESAGFHSRFQPKATEPLDLVIDFGRPHPVDRIAVFPVRGVFRGETIEGYGFPERFTIELSLHPDFSSPVARFDSEKAAPVPRPGYPRQFSLETPTEARFLRLQVREHWARDDGRLLSSFGEIMVMADGRDVALRTEVEAESFLSLPDWHRDHLVDGQTDLGLPVLPEPSPSNGFLSKGQRHPETKKWVQLELPRAVNVDEVFLIPAQPFDAPDQFGHGFPRRFGLLASMDPDFSDPQILADHTEQPFPNPGDNPVVFAAEGVQARFLRLEVDELWHISTGVFSLTLAEIQVYEDGENVAIGAAVTASDVFTGPVAEVWKPEYLVDGFSSQNRLIGLESWLQGLEKRAEIERQIRDVEESIAARTDRIMSGVLGIGGALTAVSLVVLVILIGRRKRALLEHQEALRVRIARDLHDDLGSRLGGMRLLSEHLLTTGNLSPDIRADLEIIHQSSGEATEAMRDIVWLLDSRESSLEKLRRQMKRLVPSLVGPLPWDFKVVAEPEAEVDFEFRRQVILAFREAVTNAARHSKSEQIHCRVGGDSERFWFEVRDEGTGFRKEELSRVSGLAHVQKRAEALDGEATIESEPGAGTVVTFSAPYRGFRPAAFS